MLDRMEVLTPTTPSELVLSHYEAVLFDLDGTLVDSLPLHYRAYRRVFERRGTQLEWDVFMHNIGPPAASAIPKFAAAVGLDLTESQLTDIHLEKKSVFADLLGIEAPSLLPVSTILSEVMENQKSGLVTSGNRSGARLILKSLGWIDKFDVVVTGDDVVQGKPSPEPYLHAARILGVDPKACLALEDTDAGLLSARQAGMKLCDVRKMNQI